MQSSFDDIAKAFASEAWEAEGKYSRVRRGTMRLPGRFFVLFGNDGYARDERARHEVDLLRRRLQEGGLAEVLGFGVSADRNSWALLVRGTDPRHSPQGLAGRLDRVLWEAWFDACEIVGLFSGSPE